MYTPRIQAGCFALEGLNSLGTTYYFYYLYFFTDRQFGFSKLENLVLAAGTGLVYAASSIWGGKIAQRHGYFTALKWGYGLMALCMSAGAWVRVLPLSLLLIFAALCGAAMTWPALEALVSDGEPKQRLFRNIGIYNCVWSGFGALAYFSGGALIKAWSFQAMFLVPAGLSLLQLAFTCWLESAAKRSRRAGVASPGAERAVAKAHQRESARSPVSPEVFLRMAWIANPFGYLAINTVVAVIPALADRLKLSVMWAGFFCSVWLFTRTFSFLLLWLWPGWHYRFRWLIGAYLVMTLSFMVMLLSSHLWVILAAQVVFGLALGLIYYSSLYYSMEVGETKGEHGGWHEAMIGAGSFAGPAIGATALHFFPATPQSSTWGASVLLVAGCFVLVWLRWRRKSIPSRPFLS